MRRDQVTFLAVGFAFGALVGLALFTALDRAPELGPTTLADAGGPPATTAVPGAPAQAGGATSGGGAPMMAEIRQLRQRVQDDPQDEAALVRLANLYHDVQMWDDAIEFYGRALEVNGDQPDLLTDLGICYRGKGEYETALGFFRQASSVDANHWQSLFNIVIVTGFDLQQFDTAREALGAMERITPPPPRIDELRQALERAESRAEEG